MKEILKFIGGVACGTFYLVHLAWCMITSVSAAELLLSLVLFPIAIINGAAITFSEVVKWIA